MIRTLSSKHLNEHTLALTAAVAVHMGIILALIPHSSPVEIKQQIIRISMVAPNSVAHEKVEPKQVVNEPLPVAPPKPDATKLQKKEEKKPVEEKKVEQPSPQQSVNNPTSGPQAPDATEKTAARTDPVFDATYLHNPPPVYPTKARREGIQGRVMLEVEVTAQGSAGEVQIAHSSGSIALDDAAKDAVSKWRFVPAKRGDEIVEAKVLVPVEFKLN